MICGSFLMVERQKKMVQLIMVMLLLTLVESMMLPLQMSIYGKNCLVQNMRIMHKIKMPKELH